MLFLNLMKGYYAKRDVMGIDTMGKMISGKDPVGGPVLELPLRTQCKDSNHSGPLHVLVNGVNHVVRHDLLATLLPLHHHKLLLLHTLLFALLARHESIRVSA
jgi:hypothetical protein